MRPVTLALLLLPAVAAAQPIPQRWQDELDTATVAAEAGDAKPALDAVAAIGSAKLPARVRDRLASRALWIGEVLIEQKAHGDALDVFRALQRRLGDTVPVAKAVDGEAQALLALGDAAAAARRWGSLIAPVGSDALPVAVVARAELRVDVYPRLQKALIRLGRHADALQVALDQTLDAGLAYWFVEPLTLAQEALKAYALLVGRELSSDEEVALEEAAYLAPLRLRSSAAGVTVELTVSGFLEALATLLKARREPTGAARALALSRKHARVRRPYALPPISREQAALIAGAQARFAALARSLPKLEARAAADPAAALALAELYERGRVVPRDEARVAALTQRAAASGHPPALLAQAYHDPARGWTLACRALAAGHAPALQFLSSRKGRLDPKAHAVALGLAHAGNPQAWIVLAIDRARSRSARVRSAVRGARVGAPLALHHLKRLDPKRERFWRRCLAVRPQGTRDARVHATAADPWVARLARAARRYPGAAAEWARVLFADPARRAESVKAALAARRLSDHGRLLHGSQTLLCRVTRRDRRLLPAARAALAKLTDPAALHAHGALGGPQAIPLHRAESQRSGRLCAELSGWFYDPRLALQERRLARALDAKGGAWGAVYLGLLLERGIGGRADLDAARAAYARGAARGSAEGHLRLARLDGDLELATGKPRPSAEAHLRAAAKLGAARAWVALAWRLQEQGKPAADAWAKALAAKAPAALIREADRKLRGETLTPAQVKAALPLLRRAAAAGSIRAYQRLLIALQLHPDLRAPDDP